MASRADKKIEKTMHEYKAGALSIGKSNKKVKNRKQAVAIALDKARREGADVPMKKGS